MMISGSREEISDASRLLRSHLPRTSRRALESILSITDRLSSLGSVSTLGLVSNRATGPAARGFHDAPAGYPIGPKARPVSWTRVLRSLTSGPERPTCEGERRQTRRCLRASSREGNRLRCEHVGFRQPMARVAAHRERHHRDLGLAVCRLAWSLVSPRPGAEGLADVLLATASNRSRSTTSSTVCRRRRPSNAGLLRRPMTFEFSLKASRYLTHVLRLSKPTEPVRRLLGRSSGLGHKVGPILLQLPANFRADPARLASTLKAFPSSVRVAFEPRHESWYTDEVADILQQHRAAFCLSDTPQRKSPLWRTADWGYCGCTRVERTRLPATAGRPSRIGPVVSLICGTESEDVYVYFNNDHGGCAVRDAHRFALAADHAGLLPTRVPTSREASLTMEQRRP